MITLQWYPLPGADVGAYRVYRSIVGFVSVLPGAGSLNGLTLQIKIDGGALQTFTFNAGDPVALINATIVGGYAYLSADTTSMFIRTNLRQAPSTLQIVGGTALTLLGQTARTISQLSENFKIAQVPPLLDQTLPVVYDDLDGALQDFYAISVVNMAGNESGKTTFIQPILSSGSLCVIEGIVVTLQGARVPDAHVTARIQLHPEDSDTAVDGGSMTNITEDPITVLSGPDGRFSIALLQNSLVKLEIPRVGLSRMIRVPLAPYVFINDIQVDLDYRFPLGYRGVT